MSVKKDIMWRVGVVYFAMATTGLLIVGKILWLQFAEHDLWSVNSDTAPVKEVPIEANRGDIYSADNKLLAVSVPYYDIRMDLTVEELTDEVFYSEIDALSRNLASLFRDRNWLEYKKSLIRARAGKSQYFLVKRNITYDQMLKAREFPIFNRGRFKGGVRFIENSYRVKPNGYLASRTIGSTSLSEAGNVVGLEGAYDDILRGTQGLKLFKRLKGDIFVPLFDRNEIDPVDGKDIVSTIDLNIQDVAERALHKQLRLHNARHGTAVLMEVKTGDIKAIANLERRPDGSYWESVNFAIGESTVPGSTFKTASLMVALEDGVISINDSVDIGKGITFFSGTKVEDSQHTYSGMTSVKDIFEASSNVGMTKIISENYKSRGEDFIEGLYKLGLNQKLGVEILGEGVPFIKNRDHSQWSGLTLPMMAMGYEIMLTPLQILSFYNGIANDGRVMKPRFVKEIRYRGEKIREIKPEVLNPKLCSRKTREDINSLLIGVVEKGTATNLRNKYFKIAGKTGTAQIPDSETGYRVKSRISYQASFVGYFPAEDPRYSCIVVINAPSNDIYYGNLVAGPVFREIANKVYSTQLDMHHPVNDQMRPVIAEAPYSKSGYAEELLNSLKNFDVNIENIEDHSDWVSTRSAGDTIKILPRTIQENFVPNVVGMGLKDAVYLLESAGLKVRVSGRGTVRTQSITPGSNIRRGQSILLEMSLSDS
ncbi:MAG: transpeptidase family protein [Bacteroidales bacterium]|nr:transpeptidase family protein [Bacteroidales bacterium]